MWGKRQEEARASIQDGHLSPIPTGSAVAVADNFSPIWGKQYDFEWGCLIKFALSATVCYTIRVLVFSI